MSLFKSKEEKNLDTLIQLVNMNMENNYKDEAQKNYKELIELFDAYRNAGKLKQNSIKHYEEQLALYSEKLKDYSHKDQKPYWT